MSLHINANKGDIAETVLLPGDPLRAKWIAETFLKDAVCYNEVRGMLGYTGLYKGRRISVQGSGMGIPSAMIYFHELINEYRVKNLIRVGSAGAYRPDIKVRDIVIAMAASTTSGINDHFNGHFAPAADFELLMKAVSYAEEKGFPIKVGNVLSTDQFYEVELNSFQKWAEYGVLCAEMEAAGLYTIAAKNKVRALTILTISDSLVTDEQCTFEERESSFAKMVEIALNIT